jgi:hypothetical protein
MVSITLLEIGCGYGDVKRGDRCKAKTHTVNLVVLLLQRLDLLLEGLELGIFFSLGALFCIGDDMSET